MFASAIVVMAALAVAGCPQEGPGTDNQGDAATFEAAVVGPSNASKGESITLSAEVSGGAADAMQYAWFQTYGRPVALSGVTSPAVSFVAPSLKQEAELRFRVDVSAGGATRSAEVAVMIAADEALTGDDDLPGGGSAEPAPRVRLETSFGEIVVELDRERAPLSVNNFLRYVDEGAYDGTIFHRVIEDFVVQGGGFLSEFESIPTRDPILNEGGNGLRNDRGTIAMARTNSPNSATSQFYFNVVNNDDLNYVDEDNPGYAVFGRVISGLSVVDEIAVVETESRDGRQDVPVEDVMLIRAERVERDDESADAISGSRG